MKGFYADNWQKIGAGGLGKPGAELIGGLISGYAGAKPIPEAAIKVFTRFLTAYGYDYAAGKQSAANKAILKSAAVSTAAGWNDEAMALVEAVMAGEELI